MVIMEIMENLYKIGLRNKNCFFGEVAIFSVRSHNKASARRTQPRNPFSKRILKVQFRKVLGIPPRGCYIFQKPATC